MGMEINETRFAKYFATLFKWLLGTQDMIILLPFPSSTVEHSHNGSFLNVLFKNMHNSVTTGSITENKDIPFHITVLYVD
jgi:hypothetical protein